jgi:hypothetical protein
MDQYWRAIHPMSLLRKVKDETSRFGSDFVIQFAIDEKTQFDLWMIL